MRVSDLEEIPAEAMPMLAWCMDQNARMTESSMQMVIDSQAFDLQRKDEEIAELRAELSGIRRRVLWLLTGEEYEHYA